MNIMTTVIRNRFRFLIIVLLMLGIFLRFVNLDRKPYWADEVFTSRIVSGYPEGEVIEKFSQRPAVFTPPEILRYQFPNSERNFMDALKLANLDTHPPLFNMAARIWVQQLGNSVAAVRSMSAVISLLSIVCIYWLSLELFKSPLTGWFSVMLISVSPFHIVYAQEARSYSLLILAVLLSSAALLSALRQKSPLAWAIYALTLIVGLYTHLFIILTICGYSIYIAILEPRLSKISIGYLVSTLLAFAFFIPRIIIFVQNYSSFAADSAWIGMLHVGFLAAIRLWVENMSLAFCDLTGLSFYTHIGQYGQFILNFSFFALVIYSIYFLYSSTSKPTYLFIFTLIGSTAFFLIIADILVGGVRQTLPRYLIPCYLGIQLSVSHLLAVKTISDRRFKLWQIITVFVVTSGVISGTIISQAQTWTNKYNGEKIIELASIINNSNRPLLIYNSESDLVDKKPSEVNILSIIHKLNPDVSIKFINDREDFSSLDRNKNIFILNPTVKNKHNFRANKYELKIVKSNPSNKTHKGIELLQANKIN
jgi:uncharacterized membrane protein